MVVEMIGDLDSELSGSTCCPEDYDGLSGLKVGTIVKRQPGGTRRIRKRGGCNSINHCESSNCTSSVLLSFPPHSFVYTLDEGWGATLFCVI